MLLIPARDIRVLSGEFKVLAPDETFVPEGSVSATLILACRFSVIGEDGSVVASGVATNGDPVAGIKVELSDTTLGLFSAFYESLEEDIKKKLTGEVKEDERSPTERLLDSFGLANALDDSSIEK